MSTARVVILGAMIVGGSGVACTAIVMGKLSDVDFGPGDGGRSSSSSSSSGTSSSTSSSGRVEVDECSLLQGRNLSDPPESDNKCARCISKKCTEHVDYACNRGEQKKVWFEQLKNCAQNPFDGFPEPDSGAGYSWGCGLYEKDQEPFASQDDGAKRRASEICVHENCVVGTEPDCRLCEVSGKITGAEGRQRLRDDPCGQCFTQNCNVVLVDCCDATVMDDFIAPCAYTQDPANKRKCGQIGDAGNDPDGGYYFDPPGTNYGAVDQNCAFRLGQCFNSFCATKPECQDN